MNAFILKSTVIAACCAFPLAAAAAGAASAPAHANTNSAASMDRAAVPMVGAADYSDRARMKTFSDEKDRLEKELGTGHDKAYYRQTLEKLGYQITAVNADKPDYLEYEVVKGKDSYEVQVDFDKANRNSNKVDVTANVWKAKGTEAALDAGKDYKYVYPTAVTPNASMYSDRARTKAASGEKDRLEKALGTGHDAAYYRPALEKLGFKVTAVNDKEPDYLEYEVVKGKDSYEVQVDFDNKSRQSTKVDVTTNMWRADATKRALGE